MTKLTIVPPPFVRPPRLTDIPEGSLVVIDGMLLQKVRNDPTRGRVPEVVFRVVLPCSDGDRGDIRVYGEGGIFLPGAEVRSEGNTDFSVPAEVEVRL